MTPDWIKILRSYKGHFSTMILQVFDVVISYNQPQKRKKLQAFPWSYKCFWLYLFRKKIYSTEGHSQFAENWRPHICMLLTPAGTFTVDKNIFFKNDNFNTPYIFKSSSTFKDQTRSINYLNVIFHRKFVYVLNFKIY